MYQPALIQTTDGIASNSLMGIGDVIVVNTELDLAAGTVVDSWLSLCLNVFLSFLMLQIGTGIVEMKP